ncbi:MAG TPA: lactate dehydrogenase [Dehalococcoidia bacterium]|jgi:phosphoglycerate dehydrogenase-like enzyme|nr:lactate dehydrogenase [Dehalococcoidia bacterium]HIK88561.1 lactate dehydrogenase [Dehalococcoidia bacterium]
MGHSVIYYGEDDGARTIRALELGPQDLDWGVVSPEAPSPEQAEAMADAVAIITNGLSITTEMLTKMPKMKLLQVMSAGFDRLDVPAIRELGIEVCNNSPAIARSVAEHAISMMMMVYKRLPQGIDGVKDGTWQQPAKSGEYGKVYELSGRTVGIIGLGNIGTWVAKMLRGFETTTLYTDVRKFSKNHERDLNVTRVSMDELLDRCDVVTVHVPLSSSTTGLMGHREFAAMRPDAIFINTCRGPVQNEAELIEALEAGEILGAGLDVTEVEPTPLDSPLMNMDNVVLTPHLAGSSEERVDRALVFSFENARRALNGEKLENLVQVLD